MRPDKRYQVFISSTFRDLISERQAALKAILELDHMPAGMELFPAGDASAWQLIKDVIDASDYYVLIVGGRYGSLDEEGIGFTEKEYDYAIASRKPVIAVLHEKPEGLPREKTETDAAAWEKLKKFRQKVEKAHTCTYWNSADDLKARVIVAVTAEVKRNPQVGWVRADQVPSEATLADVLALRQRVAELQAELDSERSEAPPGTEELAQGDDITEIEFDYETAPVGDEWDTEDFEGAKIQPTWNELFAALAPLMINEASGADLRAAFNRFVLHALQPEVRGSPAMEGKKATSVTIQDRFFSTLIVQFRALGLIRASERKRSLKDTGAYWTLTPYGDRLMVQLRALRREGTAPTHPARG